MKNRDYLYLDLGFYENCNLKCSYCRGNILMNQSNISFEELKNQVKAFNLEYDIGVVKLSGYGEITIWKHFNECIKFLSELFSMVQVITNGTFGKKALETILKYQNVSPNITLDGHLHEMNWFRIQDSKILHDKILYNLNNLVQNGKNVEVNCVLNSRNINNIRSYCEYLKKIGNGLIMFFPFPVKPFDRLKSGTKSVKPDYTNFLVEIDQIYSDYKDILPPKAYFDDMKKFLLKGKRDFRCSVHWINIGSGGKNNRLNCPNYGESLNYGTMEQSIISYKNTIRQIEEKNLIKGKIGDGCEKCFNHFHVFNIYLEGRCSLEDIMKIPSLHDEKIREILINLKKTHDKTIGK